MSNFIGVRGEVLYSREDVRHTLAVVMYEFPDCSRPYIEVSESHDGACGPVRRWPLPEAVHLLQNISEREFYEIGGREPWVSGWESECAEWQSISDEMIACGGSPSAHDVTLEQRKRMLARGERPVEVPSRRLSGG